MRRNNKWQPEFESLESMTLLSGVGVGASPELSALKTKTPALPNPLHPTGSVRGRYTLNLVTETVQLSQGKGTLSQLGAVSASGSAGLSGGSLTLSSNRGTLRVNLSNISQSGQSFTGTYTIAGGTKALAGEKGSGSITVTLTSLSTRGTFNATIS